ncbi:copper homeostasis protein [Murinocardiopsis flavida]|uniref:PF03932 family protein CutC n=1 Tax=Murinocardiopsis flavida TaxID=645275 RepID=A0A2P8D294_9ACTN|nr:copper homeostasis protein CutC [Murinocardiopsis flavida]PSK91344.1 copper homeostasis protein [Murinocardiopsis flavida]
MKFEIVVESVAGAITAERTGADRVELVSALVDGGLTPTVGAVERTLDATSRIGVFPIIRARGGDFVYDEHEAAVMERDAAILRKVGVPGVVIGALTPDGRIDRPVVERLIAAADGAEVTFHRAFDVAADPRAALDELIDLGVARVLTSGQEATAGEGAPLIAELVRRAAGRIIVMPGGGVREDTAGAIVAATGAEELHFSGGDTAPSPATHQNPKVAMGGGRVPPESERRVTSAERIVRIMRAAKG